MKKLQFTLAICLCLFCLPSCNINLLFEQPVPKAGDALTEFPKGFNGVYANHDSSQLIVVATNGASLQFASLNYEEDALEKIIADIEEGVAEMDTMQMSQEDSLSYDVFLASFKESMNLLKPYEDSLFTVTFENEIARVLGYDGKYFTLSFLSDFCTANLAQDSFHYWQLLAKLNGKPVLKQQGKNYFLNVKQANGYYYMINMQASGDSLNIKYSTTAYGKREGFVQSLPQYELISPITATTDSADFYTNPTNEQLQQFLQSPNLFKRQTWVKIYSLDADEVQPTNYRWLYISIGIVMFIAVSINMFFRNKLKEAA